MRGISVNLIERTASGTDSLGNQTWTETPVTVDNVLVGQPSAEEIVTTTQIYGKRLEYWIGIPKGDTHAWENAAVEFFGLRFETFGPLERGIDHLVPTAWNAKIRCMRCDEAPVPEPDPPAPDPPAPDDSGEGGDGDG